MQNHVKRFGDYLNESAGSETGDITLYDLFECLAMQDFPNDRVMIAADVSGPARSLTFKGAIKVIMDPTDEDIENALNQNFEWDIWNRGQFEESKHFWSADRDPIRRKD